MACAVSGSGGAKATSSAPPARPHQLGPTRSDPPDRTRSDSLPASPAPTSAPKHRATARSRRLGEQLLLHRDRRRQQYGGGAIAPLLLRDPRLLLGLARREPTRQQPQGALRRRVDRFRSTSCRPSPTSSSSSRCWCRGSASGHWSARLPLAPIATLAPPTAGPRRDDLRAARQRWLARAMLRFQNGFIPCVHPTAPC
jgi:hypothetical protein